MKKYEFYPGSEYDREFNLLYIIIYPTIVSGKFKNKEEIDQSTISNLAIYDIGKDKLTHFFEEGTINNIVHYLYEISYNEVNKKMMFNRGSNMLFNNDEIEKREKADKLFVVTEDEVAQTRQLWVSKRSGEGKTMIMEYFMDQDVWIDVYNQKILFIDHQKNAVDVKAFDW